MTARVDMDAGPNAPSPRDHLLVTGENAEAYLLANLLSGKAANRLKPTSLGMTPPKVRIFLLLEGAENVKVRELRSYHRVPLIRTGAPIGAIRWT